MVLPRAYTARDDTYTFHHQDQEEKQTREDLDAMEISPHAVEIHRGTHETMLRAPKTTTLGGEAASKHRTFEALVPPCNSPPTREKGQQRTKHVIRWLKEKKVSIFT